MKLPKRIAAATLAGCGLALAGCSCVAAYACRHAIYRPSGEGAAAIADFVAGLGAAIGTGDTEVFLPRLDPQGRKGLLIFAAQMAWANDSKVRGYVELGSLALVLAMGAPRWTVGEPIDG